MKGSRVDIKIIVNKSKKNEVVFSSNTDVCFLIDGSFQIADDIVTLIERC